MVGYATIYTMAPVFSLVLDRDLNEDLALSYPELYKDLTKVRSRVSFCWDCMCVCAVLMTDGVHYRDETYPIRLSSSGSGSVSTKVGVQFCHRRKRNE